MRTVQDVAKEIADGLDAGTVVLDYAQTCREVEALVAEHERAVNNHFCGPLASRLACVLRHYRDLATNHLAGAAAFRDDVLAYLRALVLVTESAANGATHREKDARLRGLVEMLESAIEKLRKEKFDFAYARWTMPDLWRSDYPVREYVRRIHDLEDELKRLREEKAPASEKSGPVEECPF